MRTNTPPQASVVVMLERTIKESRAMASQLLAIASEAEELLRRIKGDQS